MNECEPFGCDRPSDSSVIRIVLNGAFGQMGSIVRSSIQQVADLNLVACVGKTDHLATAIQNTQPDILIDFTQPDVVFHAARTALLHGVRPIIGTTGLQNEERSQLHALCAQYALGGIIAPNFSLGALLLMRCARDVARYFSYAEIIEMHHEKKQDAPSGTALCTAKHIHDASNIRTQNISCASHHGIPIHSVRMPGLFAHTEVLFGGIGETVRITHDCIDRCAMMPGLWLACRQVMHLQQLINFEDIFFN